MAKLPTYRSLVLAFGLLLASGTALAQAAGVCSSAGRTPQPGCPHHPARSADHAGQPACGHAEATHEKPQIAVGCSGALCTYETAPDSATGIQVPARAHERGAPALATGAVFSVPPAQAKHHSAERLPRDAAYTSRPARLLFSVLLI